MQANIVLLPGDGIGPEVVDAAERVLTAVAVEGGHTFHLAVHLIGGCAIDAVGHPLPEDTLSACKEADAVLLGAVGGPQWDDPNAPVRPEQGLLAIRKVLGLFANLRPIKPHPDLVEASPLRAERLQNVDLVILRELTGGIYFGEPRLRREVSGEMEAIDTMVYREHEIKRIARLACELAQSRSGKLTSIDKANVLESSRLWRSCVTKVVAEYPGIKLEHLLVDAAAMHLLTRPKTFDVIVTSNLFGDILSDEASVLVGSMGNLPSASFGEKQNSLGFRLGLYEPIHGSAPDIAGKSLANPIGTILSTALLLEYSLGLSAEARAIEAAVQAALDQGYRTADLALPGQIYLSTQEITTKILGNLLTAEPLPANR